MIVKLAICALLISAVYGGTTPAPSNGTTEEPQTTKAHTTDTPKPITTAPPKPETTVPIHNDTTVSPTPAPTTPAPIPPAPSNVADHPTVNLNITSKNNTCAMLVGQMLLSITYNTTDNKTNTSKIGVPVDSFVVNPSCNGTEAMEIQLKKNTTKYPIVMTIEFGNDNDHIFWKSVSINVTWDEDYFPKVKKGKSSFTVFTSDPKTSYFKATKKGSYLCNSDISTNLGSVSLETWKFQYTAYQDNVKSFSKDGVSQCSQDAKTNSIVPIAVGAALAGLVVIVLIAYLIGRRRNRKGYESV